MYKCYYESESNDNETENHQKWWKTAIRKFKIATQNNIMLLNYFQAIEFFNLFKQYNC